ncbi:MAG: hypothetical protein R3E18_11190 [Sphingomonadaceae bacterium]
MTLSPTLSNPISRSASAIIGALAWTTLSFGAALAPTPAAAAETPYYSVKLASPAKDATTIAGGVVWYCEGDACVARKGNTRPWVMCKRLARETGTITSFAYDGQALSEDQLAKCNG